MATQCSECSPKFELIHQLRDFDIVKKLRTAQQWETGEFVKLTHLLTLAEEENIHYDVEIARLTAKIFALKKEKQELGEHIRCSRSFLSPIRRLPKDILVEIFSQLNQSEGGISLDCLFQQAKCRLRVPLLASSCVCAFWRDIIESTGSLWSSFRIFPTILERDVPLVDWVLNKSKKSALHITLQGTRMVAVPSEVRTDDYVSLYRASNRLETLSILLTPEHMPALQLLQDGLRSLKHLDLASYREPSWQPPESLTMFRNAPLLTHVSLHRLSPSSLELPWGQLLKLELTSTNIVDVRQVVSQCPELVFLEAYLDIKGEPLPQGLTATASKITTLRLHDRTENAISRFSLPLLLHSLVVPSLNTLKIDLDCEFEAYPDWNSIMSGLRFMKAESRFLLSSLTINVSYMPFHFDLIPILHLFPTLTYIKISEYNDVPGQDNGGDDSPVTLTSVLMSRLTIPWGAEKVWTHHSESADILLPHLETFCIDTNNWGVHQGPILDMIWSRRNLYEGVREGVPNQHGISLLKHVNLTFRNSAVDEDLLEQYLSMKLTGLDIVIRCGQEKKRVL